MRKHLFYHLLLLVMCGHDAFASNLSAQEITRTGPPKAVLVVEFGEKSPAGSKLNDAIQQAAREFPSIQSIVLPDEYALEYWLENKTEMSTGMVVLIRPHDMETIGKIPGLYPDMYFTIIDAPKPIFASNVQSVQFKEEDGIFLLGAIAGIRDNGAISVMGLSEDERNKKMAASFTKGVKHVRPTAQINTLMSLRPTSAQHTRLASTVTSAFQEGTGIIFSMDDEIIEQALRAAKPERKMVISGNAPLANMDTSRLLTYLVKRYDLALLDVLRIYSHNQWHAGTIELGVSGGYVDYSLNADNVELFPKDAIDQIEAIKDYIGQGITQAK